MRDNIASPIGEIFGGIFYFGSGLILYNYGEEFIGFLLALDGVLHVAFGIMRFIKE